ncbi:MAG: VWA domain-containing protein [Pseudomonadota bacterium]|nr:VWA domain-containing protein [Pseudomonadota bacterium]
MFRLLLRELMGIGLIWLLLSGLSPVWAMKKDLVLVVDNSGSMRQNDPGYLTREAVATFARGLDDDSRVALLLFDTTARLEVPLIGTEAETRAAFEQAIHKIDFSGQLTNIPAAIERAIYELSFRGREDARHSIIFITDGIVDTGDPEQDREKSRWLREALTADARRAGISIFSMAFTENADFHLIQTLARETDGRYFRVPTAAEIGPTFAAIREAVDTPAQPPPEPGLSLAPGDTNRVIQAPDLPIVEDWELPGADFSEADVAGRRVDQAAGALTNPPEEPAKPVWVWVWVWAVVGISLVVMLAGGAWLAVRRKGPGPASPEHVTLPTPQPVDEPSGIAVLRDLDRVTGDAQIDISTGMTVIGRVAASQSRGVRYVVVEDPAVSRRHALIEARDLSFWLSDQGSANGTEVNGERVEGEVKLNSGDIITIHEHDFEFVVPDIEDSDATRVVAPKQNPQAMIATTKMGAREVAAMLSRDEFSSQDSEDVGRIDLDAPADPGPDASDADGMNATMARDGPMPQAAPAGSPGEEPPELQATMVGDARQFSADGPRPPDAGARNSESGERQDAASGSAPDDEDDDGLDETRIRS